MVPASDPVLLGSVARSKFAKFARFFLIFVLSLSWLYFASRAFAVWALALYLLLILGLLIWQRRLYLNPATRVLYLESGWPWVRLVFGRSLGEASSYERVVRTESWGITELSLEGPQRIVFAKSKFTVGAHSRERSAAIALVLQLPLEETRGYAERSQRPPDSEMQTLVKQALRSDARPSHIAVSCGALLLGNAVTLLGVLFADWSIASVYALFWLELCTIAVFTAVRVATGDFGWEFGRIAQAVTALLFGCGALLLVWLAGRALLLAIDIPGPPAMRILGVTILAEAALALHGIREGGAYFALLALVAGHAVAYAVDWHRGETSHDTQIRNVMWVSILRLGVTTGVALAAVFLLRSAIGGDPAAVLAVVIAARGGFEVWAHLAVHAPLWLSGDLQLLRAASSERTMT